MKEYIDHNFCFDYIKVTPLDKVEDGLQISKIIGYKKSDDSITDLGEISNIRTLSTDMCIMFDEDGKSIKILNFAYRHQKIFYSNYKTTGEITSI